MKPQWRCRNLAEVKETPTLNTRLQVPRSQRLHLDLLHHISVNITTKTTRKRNIQVLFFFALLQKKSQQHFITRLKKLLQSGTKLNMPKLPDATQQKIKPKMKRPSLTLREKKQLKRRQVSSQNVPLYHNRFARLEHKVMKILYNKLMQALLLQPQRKQVKFFFFFFFW